MFPSKKKIDGRLARLGEQPLYENIKGWRGNIFFTQNPSPSLQKLPSSRELQEQQPPSSIVEVLLPFSRFNSLPTSKCNFPWLFGSPLMCFGALVAHFLQNS